MANSGAKRQKDDITNLRKKIPTKEVTVFLPDSVSEKLEGQPRKLAEFFIEAEGRFDGAIEACKAELKRATAKQLMIDTRLTKEELLEEYRALGISTAFDPVKTKKALEDDIPGLKERRQELKDEVNRKTEEWQRLEEEIGENRLEADGWIGILDTIYTMLAGNTSPEALCIAGDIERVKKRLQKTRDLNREISAPFIEAVHSRTRRRRKAR